ncbi:NlpC/P60 family protein [Primorskyibacter sp. 2E107]|uniref:C40 family peptidase n=1 Tax=Primorskyibacter sp. 2E107 TaxID=3403458 RepID=UPI003AF529D0
MDRRTTPFNGRVAHVSLEGKVAAERFVEGAPAVANRATVDLFAAEQRTGAMDRQLLLGEAVRVIEDRNGSAFVFSDKDGYCGWVSACQLAPIGAFAASHAVSARQTHAYLKPDFKQTQRSLGLPMGARVHVIEQNGRWVRVGMPGSGVGEQGDLERYVPAAHLRPLTQPESDPVAVAERLLDTPYLWGGNSSFGIDCSGLVQIGCTLCGIPCPGDSDMQERALGETLPPDTPPKRGDLMFWKGHVAWIVDAETLLHANVHHMAVAYEPIAQAVDRIRAQGDGEVTRHARLT